MGLITALNNAVSGLNANQQNLNVLSQNISNANTPGYSNETVSQLASFEAGQGIGVSVSEITRTVNQYLNSQVQSQTSANSSASTLQTYYTDIENLLGQPGGTSSIDQKINGLFTALQNLASPPPTVETQTSAVTAANNAAGQISGLASSLYNLQLQADNDISGAVTKINSDLKTLQTVNSAIEQATATGQSTAGLLDQRDSAINDITQYIDVKASYQLNGEVSLNTTSGVMLLTPTVSTQLSYSGAGGASVFSSYQSLSPLQVQTLDASGNPVGQAVDLTTGGVPSSVTTNLTSGSVYGLLSMRDSIIPNVLNQLDQLAATVRDQINAINNAGTSYPPSNSYTGTREVNASDLSQYSGSIQIALLNGTGTNATATNATNTIGTAGGVLDPSDPTDGGTSPYSDELNGMQPLTLNLGALNYGQGAGVLSTGNIINAINQYFAPQNKLELGNLNNVQLQLGSNSTSGNTINFSFNLNNISGASAAGTTISGVTIYAGDPGNNVVAGTVSGSYSGTVATGQTTSTGNFAASLTTTSAAYYTVVANVQTANPAGGAPLTSTVSYQIVNGLSGVMNNLVGANSQAGNGNIITPLTQSGLITASLVDANGNPLPQTNGSYGQEAGYLKLTAANSNQAVAVNELNSAQLGLPSGTPPQAGTNQGFSQYFGLNNFFNNNSLTSTGDTVQGSAYNLAVASRIINNASLISTGTLLQNTTGTASAPNYTLQIDAGDISSAKKMAALGTTSLSFRSTGGIAASNTTLSQYAGQIIANTSANSNDATNAATAAQTALNTATTSAQSVSGVNLQQELANTVLYQGAYTASARVISVISALFTALLSIIQ